MTVHVNLYGYCYSRKVAELPCLTFRFGSWSYLCRTHAGRRLATRASCTASRESSANTSSACSSRPTCTRPSTGSWWTRPCTSRAACSSTCKTALRRSTRTSCAPCSVALSTMWPKLSTWTAKLVSSSVVVVHLVFLVVLCFLTQL